MTGTLTSHDEVEAQLDAVRALARQLGRVPGRPLIMRTVGVTDTRARKLIDLINSDHSRTPLAGLGGTSDVRFPAPAGDHPHQGAPAGATQPPAPDSPGQELGVPPVTRTTATEDAPAPAAVKPTVAPPQPGHHQQNEPTTTNATTNGGAGGGRHAAPPPPAATSRPLTKQQRAETRRTSPPTPEPMDASAAKADTPAKVHGSRGFYIAAFFCTLMSIDTSWRFVGAVLHINWLPERIAMFAVLEISFVACAVGMRANVREHGRPGAPRLLAWGLCALAAVMAWQLSGFWDGMARIGLGPVLGLVMLHLALGIERRATSNRTTTGARILRELRERFLSRFGLADDERDALARTRDRAARRAARLALSRWALFRHARLDRALRHGDIAHDAVMRGRMLAELAIFRHASQLRDLPQPSPWLSGRDNSDPA